MRHPFSLQGAALAVACCAALVSPASARPLFSLGGGWSTDNTFGRHVDSPFARAGARGALGDRWSVFLSAGYQALETSEPGVVCFGPGCPTDARYTSRARYVPLALGLRLSSSSRGGSARPFLDLAPSLWWARFEDEHTAWYQDGRRVTSGRSARQWLSGVEVGAGVHHALGGRMGLEWGVRWASVGAPTPTPATEGITDERIQRAAVGLSLTF